jgi:hypothetical protein
MHGDLLQYRGLDDGLIIATRLGICACVHACMRAFVRAGMYMHTCACMHVQAEPEGRRRHRATRASAERESAYRAHARACPST